MIDTIIVLCSIFGLSFLVKESDGPFGVIGYIRNKLMNNKYVGVFFFKLFDCFYCVGCHSGWIVYLMYEKDWNIVSLFLWMLGGGTISLFSGVMLDRIYK